MVTPVAVVAPPSQSTARRQKVSRIKALRGKTASSRSAAETKELVDSLVALLPADLQAALGS